MSSCEDNEILPYWWAKRSVCHSCKDTGRRQETSGSETIEFIAHIPAGSPPSYLHPFALFSSSHRNVSHKAFRWVFAQAIHLNHIWGIASSDKNRKTVWEANRIVPAEALLSWVQARKWASSVGLTSDPAVPMAIAISLWPPYGPSNVPSGLLPRCLNVLSPDVCMTHVHTSFTSSFKCQLLSRAFPAHPIKNPSSPNCSLSFLIGSDSSKKIAKE